MKDDRRKDGERYEIFLYARVIAGGSQAHLIGRVQNISGGGLAINVHHPPGVTSERLQKGSAVRVMLEGIAGAQENLDGHVLDIREGDVGTNVAIGFDTKAPDLASNLATLFRPPPPSWVANWCMLDKEALESSGVSFLTELKAKLGESGPLENIVDRMDKAGVDLVFIEDNVVHAHDEPIFDGFHHRRYRSGDLHRVIHFFRQDDYFGYLVLRPLQMESLTAGTKVFLGRVGRSALRYPEELAFTRDGPRGKAGQELFLLTVDYPQSVLGESMNVRTFEYRQQNMIGGTCGHATLQSVSGYLNRLARSRVLSASVIREAAQAANAVGTIVDGLYEDQVARAITMSGLNVRAYFSGSWHGGTNFVPREPVAPGAAMRDMLMLAIDSQLSPVAFLRGPSGDVRHVVCGVGRTGNRQGNPVDPVQQRGAEWTDVLGRKKQEKFYTVWQWARSLLVHDDATGPFRRIAVTTDSDPVQEGEPQTSELDVLAFKTVNDITSIIWPVPPDVVMNPSMVLNLARESVRVIYDYGLTNAGRAKIPVEHLQRFLDAVDSGSIVYGCRLTRSYRLRQGVLAHLEAIEQGSAVTERERDAFVAMPLPRFVFVVTLSTLEDARAHGPYHAPLLGYLVFDSTAHVFSSTSMLFARIGELQVEPDADHHGQRLLTWQRYVPPTADIFLLGTQVVATDKPDEDPPEVRPEERLERRDETPAA